MQKIIKLINSIIKKIMTKEVILYIVFGVLTTVVNVGTFYVLTTFCHVNENISNVIAIFLAVVFAYITNRRLVFNSKASNFKEIFMEMLKFFSARLFTMIVEFFGFMLLFNVLNINKYTYSTLKNRFFYLHLSHLLFNFTYLYFRYYPVVCTEWS